jgi:hypothetical protein
MFLCTRCCELKVVHKKQRQFLYFLAYFNNFHENCLTISIQNPNLTNAALSALFSKYKTKNWLLVDQFLLDFDNLHNILTRNVSQI